MINLPERAVLIVCPDHNRHVKAGCILRSKIRYVLVNEETWWDEPTWFEYKMWGYKYPKVKVHIILSPCKECIGKPITRHLIGA